MPGRSIRPHITHLRTNPASAGESLTDRTAHQVIQFQQRQFPAFFAHIFRINVQSWHTAFLSYRLYIYSGYHTPVRHRAV